MPNTRCFFIAASFCTVITGACSNRSKISEAISRPVSGESVSGKRAVMQPEVDTSIYLTVVSPAKHLSKSLSPAIARKTLFAHFKKLGYITPGDESAAPKGIDREKMEVTYDTLFLATLNRDKFPDAVISYWLAPRGASGNCWQPHKAVVISTTKGYMLMNEDLMPSNYTIDSIMLQAGRPVIMANDYDCGNHVVTRKIKISIKEILP